MLLVFLLCLSDVDSEYKLAAMFIGFDPIIMVMIPNIVIYC